jgi:hypothetical protein
MQQTVREESRALLAIRALAVAAFALSVASCERGLPVGEGEKAMLLRAADLVPFGYGLADTQKFETFTKTRYFDGSSDITYEHETPDSEEDHPLYMNVTVTFERKASDAIVSRGAEKMAIRYSLKANDIELRELPDFYPFGDASEFFLLEKDGAPVGSYFVVRQGARAYTVMMTGMYFDDADEWKKLIAKKLDKFSTYAGE